MNVALANAAKAPHLAGCPLDQAAENKRAQPSASHLFQAESRRI